MSFTGIGKTPDSVQPTMPTLCQRLQELLDKGGITGLLKQEEGVARALHMLARMAKGTVAARVQN